MWVVMDGGKENQQIIIDLGGIHNAATKTVNLRDYLDKGDKSTHTLTVLYMERGAGASNCYMNFTLPNVTISQVTTDALGTLNFQKVNKKGAGLSDARFTLYNDEECTTQIATANAKNPYTVYTIGFALNDEGDRAKTFLSGGTYDGKKYPVIASSSDCAKTADDAASLTQIFQSISSTINKNVDITGATITDVIDSRFEIVDRGNVITETNFEGGKYTLENGGIVTKRNDGTYQVQWTDQTIKHTTDGTNGWSRTITVKAKDSFIGGNNIPTNVSPDSKISVGDLKKVLDQPTVNVKVNLVVKDKEITIYKGDSVPMDEQIRNVLGKTLAYEVDQILTVLPEQTESLGITDGDDYVTLVTCTPYAVNTHRLLVRGHRVPMKAAKAVQKTEKKVTGITNPTLPMLALCVVIGIVIAVILVAGINSVQNKKRRRK